MGQTSDHQADHRDIDKGFAGSRQAFVVLAQAALAVQPSECTLDYPALGQHLEADLICEFFDDLQRPAEGMLDPLDEFATIAAIGPDEFQPTPARILRLLDALKQSLQQNSGTVAVLDVGG